jgi:acyl-coenzyme A thioesterase PaaI-like protein
VQTGPVTAEGTVVHRGRRTATTESKLVDGLGRVLATGTSTLMLLTA